MRLRSVEVAMNDEVDEVAPVAQLRPGMSGAPKIYPD